MPGLTECEDVACCEYTAPHKGPHSFEIDSIKLEKIREYITVVRPATVPLHPHADMILKDIEAILNEEY